MPPDENDWIAGAAKALAIIEAFDEDHQRMNATQVAARAAMSRTAARRYLLTLSSLGYAETDGRAFWLAPRVVRLGTAYFASARLPRVVQPFLQRITGAIHESALLAVLDGDEVLYIARNAASRVLPVGFVLGSRAAAPLSSAGMVLLAYRSQERQDAVLSAYEPTSFTPQTVLDKDVLRAELEHIRRAGYMLSEQQLEPGMRGVSVPLRDHAGSVIAALSVSMPIGHESSNTALARVLPVLQETASLLRPIV